ncbi:MAG: M28 family peptidase [Halobacteriales archaeon]
MDRTDWIGDRFVSTLGTDLLADLTEIGARLGASEGEQRGHDRVMEAFETIGAHNVQQHEFDLTKWERNSAAITTSGSDTPFECIALPGSPATATAGELVHLGYGLPEDFENADLEDTIVVARSDVPDYHDRWLHRREKYFRAYEAGANAFVFQNHVEGCLPPTGSVGGGEEVMGPLPAVGVSKEIGEQLRRYADRGHDATVDIDVAVSDGTSQNVTAELGPDTDETVLLTAHVDGHDISQGALDNGSGIATVVEAGAALADIEDQLETRVRLIGFGAEELGLKGSQQYTKQIDTDTVKTIVNGDGVGRGRDMRVRTCGFEEMGAAIRSVGDAFDHPIQVVPRIAPHSDHWPFVWRGIPGVQVASDTGSGRGYGHTAADTFDKIDRRAIRTHGVLVADFVRRLAEADRSIDARDPAEIRDELIAEEQDISMRIAGEWPFADSG